MIHVFVLEENNFRLSDISPCIGAGTSVNTSLTDLDGNSRGTPPNMGAYENPINKPISIESLIQPNPFNPFTNIAFSLDHSGDTKLIVYNISGQIIDVIIDDYMEPGTHSTVWSENHPVSTLQRLK